jgi:hypothetical protein
MNSTDKFNSSAKLQTAVKGSAVVIQVADEYYLLTAEHVVKFNDQENVCLTNVRGHKDTIQNPEYRLNRGDDVCVMKLPSEIGEMFSSRIKGASFEGSGYACEIEGYPENAPDGTLRIENNCHVDKTSEAGDRLIVKWNEQRADGMKMVDLEAGFSGSGVYVDSLGEKYLIGIVFKVDDARNQFLGWKLHKINEVLRNNEWQEIPLVSIELQENILKQYTTLINNSKDVLGRIKDSIIGYIKLQRQPYRDEITKAINRKHSEDIANVVIVTGEAGIGKSALTKGVLLDMGVSTIAILGDDLDERTTSDILANLNIKENLEDLYFSPVWGDGKKVILIESAERMLNGNTDTALMFIDNIRKAHNDVIFIFTIRKHALRMLRMNMMSNGIKVEKDNVIEIGPLTEKELSEVKDKVNHISPYLASEKTKDIISIPYYLNIACSLDIEDRKSLNDDNLKNDLCSIIVKGKHDDIKIAEQRVASLINVARLSANNSMGLVECKSSAAIQSLENDEILVGNKAQCKLRPNHDLLTDWAIRSYIENLYLNYQIKKVSLQMFYDNLDRNVASRNIFKAFIKEKIAVSSDEFNSFIKGSLSIKLNDYIYDDLFYALLDSDNGSYFLTSIKDVLMQENGKLAQKIGKALSYMFRDIDFEGRRFIEERGLLDSNEKYRNSQFIVPVGKGWSTFVDFLYVNRDIFYANRTTFIPLLLECELVKIDSETLGNLPQQVFEILADDLERWLHDDLNYDYYEEKALRLLFKWIKRDVSRIEKLTIECLNSSSYKHESIRKFILTESFGCMIGFIYYCTNTYKSIIQKDWIDENGIVDNYHDLHIVSALSTSYYSFLMAKPQEAIELLCDMFNYNIDKLRGRANLEKITISIVDKTINVYGNAELWREYRGVNYRCHIQECILMAFEKWMLDSIRNNLNKAQYAMSQKDLLKVYDIVYYNCHNVAMWAVLASVATCYPYFVGMKAMPIYSTLIFIKWDKVRYSSELNKPFLSPISDKRILEEIKESYKRPHRKKDLENVILNMSLAKGYSESFDKLIEHFKKIATTYEERVVIGRMDKKQYDIVSKNDKGIILQGKPYDDIKSEAESYAEKHSSFIALIENGNNARKMYDSTEEQNYKDWRKAYDLRNTGPQMISPNCLIAAWGVKCFWAKLDCFERRWCVKTILDDVINFSQSHIYTVYIEYTSDALLYILVGKPNNKTINDIVLLLIDAIDDNDTLFEHFENTFKKLIWKNHPNLANRIIRKYLALSGVRQGDLDRFTQVCKLIPFDVLNSDWNEQIVVYIREYIGQWSVRKFNKYGNYHNLRLEVSFASYILESPNTKRDFIEDEWLKGVKSINMSYDRNNPISNIFSHYSYLVHNENKNQFWELWEIMLEWYKTNRSPIILSALLLHFELMRSDLLNNWEVLDGAKEHINKILVELSNDAQNLIPRLLCRIGFNELLPDSLRFVDRKILEQSSNNPDNYVIWENAIEDLYDNSVQREAIRNDQTLASAYLEILNGLVNNGSAIAYIIRDYYI